MIDEKILNAQDSIHTIKEGDFSMEEDGETLHEQSRDLMGPNSKMSGTESPGHRVPRSELDITLSKFQLLKGGIGNSNTNNNNGGVSI